MSVSMVAAPCRRLVQAARWNGSAPQTTTGAARVSDSHCQASNCSGGTIAIAMTGTVSTRQTSSRSRSARVPSRSCACSTSPSPGAPAEPAGGGGSAAE